VMTAGSVRGTAAPQRATSWCRPLGCSGGRSAGEAVRVTTPHRDRVHQCGLVARGGICTKRRSVRSPPRQLVDLHGEVATPSRSPRILRPSGRLAGAPMTAFLPVSGTCPVEERPFGSPGLVSQARRSVQPISRARARECHRRTGRKEPDGPAVFRSRSLGRAASDEGGGYATWHPHRADGQIAPHVLMPVTRCGQVDR
jgi:hypothetical protein